MAWEALNNIASTEAPPSSAGSSSSSTTTAAPTPRPSAASPNHLTALRTSPRYEPVLDAVKRRLNGVPGVGPAVYDALHAMKKGMKDVLAPQGLFEDLGLKYVGPIDGHDRAAMEQALDPGEALRRPGHRARAHPARASATTPPSGTRPTSSTRPGRSTWRPARRPRAA